MNHPESTGDFETTPLDDSTAFAGYDAGHLMITELGPLIKVGMTSVAVGFGNVIKMISAGHEHFDRTRDQLGAARDLRTLAARRRKTLGSTRLRT